MYRTNLKDKEILKLDATILKITDTILKDTFL